nr:transcriptional activator ptab [Quercus suber]
MLVMADLMSFSQEHKLRPERALEELVKQYDNQGVNGNPQIHLPPNGVPVGQRTPSMQSMHMPPGNFSSPAMANMHLPNGMNGSPHIAHNTGLQPGMGMQPNSHTPSPHQSNMAAPSMMAQASQQGTNSSAASVNTSPQVNNKRRRSTVKLEDDNPGGPESGNRVKPSPRLNKKSKPGG